MFLSNASLNRPVTITVIIIAMVVMGAYSYLGLGMEFLPSVDMPVVTVVTVYPGAGPEEVETLVTDVIEDAVSEVNGIDEIKSTSMENVSQIAIQFEMEMDVNIAAVDIKEKVDAAIANLPEDAESPVIMKLDVNASPVANLVVTGSRPLEDLYELTDNRIKDYFSKIPGIASAEIFGGKIREIQVLVDQSSLTAHGLTLMHIVGALGEGNIDLPSGRVTENKTEYSIRLNGEFETLEEIQDFELVNSSGKTVPITAVAEVVDDFEEQRELAQFNGKEAIGLILKKQGDANTVSIAARVLQEVDKINESLPGDVRVAVVNEGSAFIRASNDDVIFTMFFGILLTVLVLLLFLHDFKQTLIAAISMPVSIISTFMLLNFAGFTLNVMTMMALAISVGILVTNSIVVIENIHRHLRHGESLIQAAKNGAGEIAVAVFGSTMTNIVVFLPIAFMSGMVGQFFYQFGITVAFATVISMIISLTLTPILSSKFMRENKEISDKKGLMDRFSKAFNSFFTKLSLGYVSTTRWTLNHRWLVIMLAVVMFAVSIFFAGSLGSEFIATPDQSELSINLEMAPGTSLEETTKAFQKLEKFISDRFGDTVQKTFVKIGTVEGVSTSADGVHLGTMLLRVIEKHERSINIKEIADDIRREVNIIPGASITVLQPSPMGGTQAEIQLEVMGPDLDELSLYASEMIEKFKQVEGAVDVESSWRSGKPEIVVNPRRQRIKDYGLSVYQVAMNLRGAVEGIVPGEFRVGSEEYDIRVKLAESDKKHVEDIAQLDIPLNNGSIIPLSEVARPEEVLGPTQVYRYAKQKTIEISSNTKGRPVGNVIADFENIIDEMNLPPEIDFTYTGTVKMMGESFAEMGAALLLAIVLTYLVLAAILESYIQPLTIMITLPLALIGVIFALLFTGQALGMFAMLAFIMLVGIVVNNGILIIEYISSQRKEGVSRTEAVLESVRVKLRPIIMTTLATIFGMLPLAVGNGIGSELRVPMGIVTIGGLLVSAVMTLFVVPVLYTFFDDLSKKKRVKAEAGS